MVRVLGSEGNMVLLLRDDLLEHASEILIISESSLGLVLNDFNLLVLLFVLLVIFLDTFVSQLLVGRAFAVVKLLGSLLGEVGEADLVKEPVPVSSQEDLGFILLNDAVVFCFQIIVMLFILVVKSLIL